MKVQWRGFGLAGMLGLVVGCAGPQQAHDTQGDGEETVRIAGPCSRAIYEGKALQSREERGYDAAGRLEVSRLDEDGDGKFDRVLRYVYNVDGQIAQQLVDEGADGRYEQVTWASYDTDGTLRELRRDLDGDGKPELKRVFERDRKGRTLRSWDAAFAPGKPAQARRQREEIRYDEAGCAVFERWTVAPEQVTTIERSCNAKMQPLRLKTTSLGSTTLLIKTYDAQGRLQREALDLDADGSVDLVTTTTYQGSLAVRRSFDRGADGSVEREERLDYSCWKGAAGTNLAMK